MFFMFKALIFLLRALNPISPKVYQLLIHIRNPEEFSTLNIIYSIIFDSSTIHNYDCHPLKFKLP